MKKTIKKRMFMTLYRLFAKNLPPYKIIWKRFRTSIVRRILENPPKHFTVEYKADFQYDLKIGENSGIGIRSVIPPMVTIGDNVMMGPTVTFLLRLMNTPELISL